MTALPLILTVFVACAVEAVEALTIVLAVGTTRGWSSALLGTVAGGLVLATVVVAFGPAIAVWRLTAAAADRLAYFIGSGSCRLGKPLIEYFIRTADIHSR